MIRQANINDVDALVQLRLRMLQDTGNLKSNTSMATLKEAIRIYMLKEIPKVTFIAWVAEEERVIVGTSGLVFFERPPSEGNLSGIEAYVMNMYTVPEWRGKGIATTLLEEIIRFVKDTDARRIWLQATPCGRPIYEKAGFVPTISETEIEMELIL